MKDTDNSIISMNKEKRLEIVKIAKDIGISKTAKLFNKSRTTITDWIRRYDKLGEQGLSNRGKGKTKHSNRMPDNIIDQIIRLKKENPKFSAYTIKKELNINYSPKTIYKKLNHFKNEKLISEISIQYKKSPFLKLFLSIKKNNFINNINASNILPNYRIAIEDINTGLYFIGFSNEKSDLAVALFCDYFFSQLSELEISLSKISLYTTSILSSSTDSFLKFILTKKYQIRLIKNSLYKIKTSKKLFFEKKNNIEICRTDFLAKNYSFMILKNIDLIMKQNKKSIKSYKNIIHSLPPIIVDNYIKDIREIENKKYDYHSKSSIKDLEKAIKFISTIDKGNEKILSNNYLLAEKNYEKLLQSLNYIQDEKLKFHILRMFVNVKLFHGKWINIKKYLKEMNSLAISSNDKLNLLLSYQLYGEYYSQAGNFRLSSKYFQLYYNIARKLFIQKIIEAKIFYQSIRKLALAYIYLDEMKLADKYFKVGLKEIHFLNNDIEKSTFYFTYGDYYRVKRNFKKALYYTNKANEEVQDSDLKLKKAQIGIAFGNIYGELNQFTLALSYYDKSLVIYKLNNMTLPISIIYNNIANIYIKSKQYDKALSISFKSLELSEKSNNIISKLNIFVNLGSIYTLLKKYKTAETYLKDSIIQSKKIKNIYLIKGAIFQLASLYYIQGKILEVNKLCIIGVKKLNHDNSIYFQFKHLEILNLLTNINNNLNTNNFNKTEILKKINYHIKKINPNLSKYKFYAEICSFYFQIFLLNSKIELKLFLTSDEIKIKFNYYFNKVYKPNIDLIDAKKILSIKKED